MSVTFRRPNATVTSWNVSSANGSAWASASTNCTRSPAPACVAFSRGADQHLVAEVGPDDRHARRSRPGRRSAPGRRCRCRGRGSGRAAGRGGTSLAVVVRHALVDVQAEQVVEEVVPRRRSGRTSGGCGLRACRADRRRHGGELRAVGAWYAAGGGRFITQPRPGLPADNRPAPAGAAQCSNATRSSSRSRSSSSRPTRPTTSSTARRGEQVGTAEEKIGVADAGAALVRQQAADADAWSRSARSRTTRSCSRIRRGWYLFRSPGRGPRRRTGELDRLLQEQDLHHRRRVPRLRQGRQALRRGEGEAASASTTAS